MLSLASLGVIPLVGVGMGLGRGIVRIKGLIGRSWGRLVLVKLIGGGGR